jgi:threonine/homoserine/homoserine lactone efflux protein
MNSPYAELVAGGMGFVAGFVTSIPGGPVNASILNDGARAGLRRTLLIGLGAVLMESIYCGFAFASFAGLFTSNYIRATMELVSLVLMLWLGFKYIGGQAMPGEVRGVALAEKRIHPHTAFWKGFVRVLGNPGILVLWLSAAAMVLSHDWVEPNWSSKGSFIGGVALGGLAWFSLLAYGVCRRERPISSATLARMARFSGIFLLGTAVVIAVRLVKLLVKH